MCSGKKDNAVLENDQCAITDIMSAEQSDPCICGMS